MLRPWQAIFSLLASLIALLGLNGKVIEWDGLGEKASDSKFEWFFGAIQEKLYELSGETR
jgi:hypothetical protein